MKNLSLKLTLTALVGFFSLFSTSIFSQGSPNFEWATKAGGNKFDDGRAIAVDNQGNSYVTGSFYDTATFGSTTLTSSGYDDIFIAKLDANGNYLWAKKAGGSSNDVGRDIAIDNQGNSYVTGYFKGTATFGNATFTSSGYYDAFITKLDLNGNFIWAKQIGGIGNDVGWGIAVDNQGNSYITGELYDNVAFGSTTLTNNDSGNMFITKLDSNGNFIWAKQPGGDAAIGMDIAVDSQGNSFVTGYLFEAVIFGNTTLTSSDEDNIFITKLDADGNFLWAKLAGGGYDQGHSVTVDSQGNSYVAGRFYGTVTFGSTTLTSSGEIDDIFIAKLDVNGNFLWVKQADGNGLSATDNVVDSQGNCYVTGYYVGNATFGGITLTSGGAGHNIFIAKLDANGNYLWAKKVGGSLFTLVLGIVVDLQGKIYITGTFADTVVFGSTAVTANGELDIFVAKINNSPLSVPTFESLTNILIYPNPAMQQITVESSNTLKVIELQDMSGRLITKKNVSGEKIDINVSNLNKGVYFVKVMDDQNKVKVVKVVKE